jgi:hypothetical protein
MVPTFVLSGYFKITNVLEGAEKNALFFIFFFFFPYTSFSPFSYLSTLLPTYPLTPTYQRPSVAGSLVMLALQVFLQKRQRRLGLHFLHLSLMASLAWVEGDFC